jgi:hypothetical protein
VSGKRVSIAQGMMVVALAAANLAIARATPWEVVNFPTIWVVLGILDFLVVWKLILRRSLRAFHYTFLIVMLVSFVVMANRVAMERFQPLALLFRWYQQISEERTNRTAYLGFLHIAEFWFVASLSILLAYTFGSVAAWFERRRDWDIAAFWRGALVGVCIAMLLATIDDKVHNWAMPEKYSIRWICRMLLLAVSLIVGGMTGLLKLKSRRLGVADQHGMSAGRHPCDS